MWPPRNYCMRKKVQTNRPDCSSVQSDRHIFYLLSGINNNYCCMQKTTLTTYQLISVAELTGLNCTFLDQRQVFSPSESIRIPCFKHDRGKAIEMRHYVMVSNLRQYGILSQIYDIIQSDVALQLQVHKNSYQVNLNR